MARTKIVILNWDGAGMLSRFLPSVVRNTPPEVEIVVADNGSTDGSVELLRRDFPSVRLVLLDRNYGFAGGYDRALRKMDEQDTANGGADGAGNTSNGANDNAGNGKTSNGAEADYYILLNSDVETPAGWCEPLVEMLAANDDVAAVAPKLLAAEDRAHFEYAGASGGFIDALGYPFCRGRIMGTVERDEGQYDDAREVFWATGACLACRRDVFWAVGGFDEAFFAHQEEIDLCWRMQATGWRVMVEPRSVVYHLGAGTLAPSPQKLFLNYRNNLAMLYKNLPPGSMQAIVTVRSFMNSMSAIVYLLRGEMDNFKAVKRAHKEFRAMKNEGLREKRREIQAGRIATPKGVYRGSMILRYIFGCRKFPKGL